MAAPCAAVPLPGGKLVPSGRMVMFQALMSASVIGLPSPGVSAAPAALMVNPPIAKQSSAAPASNLRIDMLDLPFAVDAPAGEAVVVLVGEPEDVGHGLGLAPLRHEIRAQRL